MTEEYTSENHKVPLTERLQTPTADDAADALEAKFDAALFCRALREVAPYASQVQGFRYDNPKTGGHCHVVRDCNLPAKHQEIWRMDEDLQQVQLSEEAAKAEYDRCHKAMMEVIQVYQIQMAWTHYMWGTTSGAFLKKEDRA